MLYVLTFISNKKNERVYSKPTAHTIWMDKDHLLSPVPLAEQSHLEAKWHRDLCLLFSVSSIGSTSVGEKAGVGFGFLPPNGWTPAVGWPSHSFSSWSRRRSQSSRRRAARPWWWTRPSLLSSLLAAPDLLSLTPRHRPDLQGHKSFKFTDMSWATQSHDDSYSL